MTLLFWTLLGFALIVGPMALIRWRAARAASSLDDPSILLSAPPEGVTPAVAAHIDGAPLRQSFSAALLDLASRGEIEFEAKKSAIGAAEVGIEIGGADLSDPRFARNRRQPAGEAEVWLLGRLQLAAAYPHHAPWDSNALMNLNLPMMLATGAATASAILREESETPDQELSAKAKAQREGGLVPGLADRSQHVRITPHDARKMPMPTLFGTFLDTYARRHGWLGALPLFTRLRWHIFGVVAGIAGIAFLSSGVSAFSDAKAGLGMGLLFGGIVAFLVAPWMVQPTPAGGRVRAQLEAYRRTLAATFAQASSIADVVAKSKLDWIATSDQAIAWAIALGLGRDVEALLARSDKAWAQVFAGIMDIGSVGQTGPSFLRPMRGWWG